MLGGVVYEDPWLAGGHNGLSNSEDPDAARDRLSARARAAQADARIRPGRDADHHGRRRVVAGGMGGLDRQSRSRADRLPVRHAAAADQGKPDLAMPGSAAADAERGRRLSSIVSARPASIPRRCNNGFIHELRERNDRQVAYSVEAGRRACGRVRRRRAQAPGLSDAARPRACAELGWRRASPRRCARRIRRWSSSRRRRRTRSCADQINCMGCLSACQFSNWAQNEPGTHRQEGRSAQLLHPEDFAGDQPFRRCANTS